MAGLLRAARRLRPRAAILVYHRVAHLEADPYKLAVSPEHFAEQMEALRRHAAPLPLRELGWLLTGGRWPRRAVAVTFDDGYADNLYQAAPLLERYAIPATVFIVTGGLASQREFWWDELEYLSGLPGLPATLDLHVEGTELRWPPAAAGEAPAGRVGSLLDYLYDALLPLDLSTRERALDRLFAWGGAKRETRATRRPLTSAEVAPLVRSGLIDVGAHTVSHPILSRAPLCEQRREIEDSRRVLEALSGTTIDRFAYPFGQRAHYSDETIRLLKELGFVLACCNFPGPVGRSTDPYQLPRYQARNVDGDRFLRWLRSTFF